MRKFCLWTAAFFISTLQVHAQWDQQMKLTACSIDVKADQFTATTFIEMEFCNSLGREIEGLYRFELKPGQVITAFQLQLDGKYRDGSIEEKWKATNAYNRIVGKRIDPALLTMEYADHYSLRIYPVPGKGCRKVTMTIQQLLTPFNNDLLYTLPLNISNPVDRFSISITVNGDPVPLTRTGLIASQAFSSHKGQHHLQWNADKLLMNQPVAFAIPISSASSLCTKYAAGQNYFALRLKPASPKEYSIQPKTLDVYWDASASVAKRDINKEINFLKQFISYHNISQLTIIPFNYKLLDTATFYTENGFNSRWQQYLQSIQYDGATQLGVINLSGRKTDMFMLFTDGNNTFGKSRPKTANALVSCVHSSLTANVPALHEIAGTGGGKVIDLTKLSMSAAINAISRGENWLMNITSASGRIITDQALPLKYEQVLLINGTLPEGTDTLYLHYGNSARIRHTEKVVIHSNVQCPGSAIDRVAMFNAFDNVCRSYAWSHIVDFGLKEKVVTPNTAYIVLERIEDYVKYNIAPPKELESACEKINYVKRDTRAERQKVIEISELDIVKNVVDVYNDRVKRWDPAEKPAYLVQLPDAEKPIASASTDITNEGSPQANDVDALSKSNVSVGELNECVVTVTGYARKREFWASAAYLANDKVFSSAPTIGQALQGRVPGLMITNTAAVPGSLSSISIRGAGTLQGNTPLYVIDGVPVSGDINDLLRPSDVETIIVLRDHQASAIFGSRASSGAIVITSKKNMARYNIYNDKPYRLKDMPDEDYLEELKVTYRSDKLEVYGRLKEQYGGYAGFYFDVAQHLYESGLQEQALEILMNAAEAANGSYPVVIAMAYTLENWKEYDKAISIYQHFIEQSPQLLTLYSNLAWVYYQAGQYQEAVDILYDAIKMNTGTAESFNVSRKATMMNEMNAIIGLHKDKLDIRHIPASVIKSLPVDMRIVVDCNMGYTSNIRIKEPGDKICDYNHPVTSNGGALYDRSSWEYPGHFDYQIKKAPKGKYKINVDFYDSHHYAGKIPTMIRIRKFKNFGRDNQSIEVENVIVDNQNGEIEISELFWQ